MEWKYETIPTVACKQSKVGVFHNYIRIPEIKERNLSQSCTLLGVLKKMTFKGIKQEIR